MRKSLTFILLFIFASSLVSAQTSKGNFLIGGGLGFSTSKTKTTVEVSGLDDEIGTTTNLTTDFIPKIGFFFADNLAGGVQMEFTSLRTKTENETNNSTKLLAGPFLRYYIPLNDESMAIFFEANFGLGNTSVGEDGTTVSTTLLGGGIGPGLTIFSNDFVGIEALAKYNIVRGKTNINEIINTEMVGEFGLSLGLQVYFTRVRPAG